MNMDRPGRQRVRLGYLALTDSAPLMVAQAIGAFAAHDLDVTLSREVSWANLRDKLVAGVLDGAQLLAPLPPLIALGANGIRSTLLSGLQLSLNGNAITVSLPLWRQLLEQSDGQPATPVATATALRRVLATRDRGTPLTFGVVHGFSTHILLLRAWLRSGGIDPDRDVRTLVVPPSQMVDSLTHDIIDGYCVGEPWNTVAVQGGVAAIAAVGCQLADAMPEKVLAVSRTWHEANVDTHRRLRAALHAACDWLEQPGHRADAASLLAVPRHLDVPVRSLLPSLTDRLRQTTDGPELAATPVHAFGAGAAGRPSREAIGALVLDCLQLLGRAVPAARLQAALDATVRPDLFDADRAVSPSP